MGIKWTTSGSDVILKVGTTDELQLAGVVDALTAPDADKSTLILSSEAEDVLIKADEETKTITINSELVFGETNKIRLLGLDNDGNALDDYTGDYKLVIGGDLKEEVTDENHETTQELGDFTVIGTTATATAKIDGVYAFNEGNTTLYKSINYTVTVSGLESNVTGEKLSESSGVITVGAEGLGDTDITVAVAIAEDSKDAKNVPSTVDYELQPGASAVTPTYAWYQKPKATDVTLYQTITGEKDSYYSEGTVIKKITDDSMVDGKETELCTVTGLGLAKNASKTDREDADVDIEVKMKGGTNGVLVVNSDLLDLSDPLKKLQIKGQGSFKFAFAEEDADLEVHEITEDKAEWEVSKGKAVLTGGMSEGYTLSSDGKTLTYTKAKTNAIATISGFKKDADATALAAALAGVTEDGVVTLTKSILDTYADSSKAVKVALKNGKDSNKQPYEYKLELAADSGFEVEEGTWTLGYKEKNGEKIPTGKAIYSGKVTAGYSISGDTITAATASSEAVDLVEVSGLNVTKLNALIEAGELKVGENDDAILEEVLTPDENGKFVLNKHNDGDNAINIFDTKKVTIKNKVKGVEFGLSVEGSDLAQADNATTWTIDSKTGTAKYYIGKSAGYVVDEKKGTTATFTQPGTDDITTTLATLSGLPKTATVDDFDVEDITDENNPLTVTGQKIVLKKSLFSGLKKSTIITLENGEDQNCTLDVDVDADNKKTSDHDVVATPYATVEKGKAIVAKGMPEYWDLTADRKVTYNPAGKATETYATVSGLKKDVTEDDVQVNLETGVITVNNSAIDTSDSKLKKTKITLKLGKNVVVGTYKLELGNNFDSGDLAETALGWDTTTKSGQATYKLTASSNGLVCDGTSITYAAGEGGTYKPTALATLKNVSATAPGAPDENSGVIKLASANLVEGKKASLGKKDPYVLALHAGDSAAKATGEWAVSGTKASLNKGVWTAGHYQKDNFTIDVVKATKTGKTEKNPLATVDGVVKDAELGNISTATSTITLDSTKLSQDVKADGSGILAFNFGAYSGTTEGNTTTNALVKGTAKNDSFTFSGSSGALTIETEGGNDYVKFGTRADGAKANTFVYNTGDGYDEIADFTTGDYLNITGATEINVKAVNGTTYVNVDGAGVITLDSFEYSAVNISGAKSANLIADENYDFDTTKDDIKNIITIGDSDQVLENYEDSFTLKGDSDFTATISFTKKTAGTTPTPSGGD